ncbi:MAG: flagella basal body P-ring formation protein FlgA [Candidatus Eisenbacteria bacterium]
MREELVRAAGCDSVRVAFSGGVEAQLAPLDAVEATIDRDAARREDPNGGDRFLVRVRGRRAGRAVEWTTFASVECFGPYLVAARAVSRGGRVAAADLTTIAGWHRPSALTPEIPLGASLYAPRGLALGAEVSREEVREAPLVARATVVTIRYHAPGLELAGRGLARADAWIGDRVAVRLEGAIRDCEAEVIGPNEVEVGPKVASRLRENSR